MHSQSYANTIPDLGFYWRQVVDCSAMVELLAAKTEAGESIAERLGRSRTLYAPYVLDGEVISALLGLRRGRKITECEADAEVFAAPPSS